PGTSLERGALDDRNPGWDGIRSFFTCGAGYKSLLVFGKNNPLNTGLQFLMVKDMPVSRPEVSDTRSKVPDTRLSVSTSIPKTPDLMPKVSDSKTKKKLKEKDKKSANFGYYLLDKMKIASIIVVASWRRGVVASWRRGVVARGKSALMSRAPV
ncbi:MAG: hypothetical protein LBD55_11190, partial [Treponema sp.]|nr:hypothetical protein [Treponema sp.]